MDGVEMNTDKKRDYFEKPDVFNAGIPTPISFGSGNTLNLLVNNDEEVESKNIDTNVGKNNNDSRNYKLEDNQSLDGSFELKNIELLLEEKKKELDNLTVVAREDKESYGQRRTQHEHDKIIESETKSKLGSDDGIGQSSEDRDGNAGSQLKPNAVSISVTKPPITDIAKENRYKDINEFSQSCNQANVSPEIIKSNVGGTYSDSSALILNGNKHSDDLNIPAHCQSIGTHLDEQTKKIEDDTSNHNTSNCNSKKRYPSEIKSPISEEAVFSKKHKHKEYDNNKHLDQHIDFNTHDSLALVTVKSKKRKNASRRNSKSDHKNAYSSVNRSKYSQNKTITHRNNQYDDTSLLNKHTSTYKHHLVNPLEKLPSYVVTNKVEPERHYNKYKTKHKIYTNTYSKKHSKKQDNELTHQNNYNFDPDKYDKLHTDHLYTKHPLSYEQLASKINRQKRLLSKLMNSLRHPHSKLLPKVLKKYHSYFKKACEDYSFLFEIDDNVDNLIFDTNSSLSSQQTSYPSSVSSQHSTKSGSYRSRIIDYPESRTSFTRASTTRHMLQDNSINTRRDHNDNSHITHNKSGFTHRKDNPDSSPTYNEPDSEPDNENSQLKQSYKNSKAGLRSRISPKFWTNEENNRLLAAVQKYGNQWGRVSSIVKNRSSRQCKEHWTRVLSKREEALGINARVIAKHSKARETEKLLIQWKNYRKIITDNKDKKLLNVDKQSSDLDYNKSNNLKSLINSHEPQSANDDVTSHKKLLQSENDDINSPLDPDTSQTLSGDSFSDDSVYNYTNNGLDIHKALHNYSDKTDALSKKKFSILCKRYKNAKPSQNKIKVGYWLPDEDRALIAAHAILGPRWIQVANIIPGRTKRQCERRFRRLREKLKKRIADSDEVADQI